jgi:hypothetical protein
MQCLQCDEPVSLGPVPGRMEWVLEHGPWSARIMARVKLDIWGKPPTYWAGQQLKAWHRGGRVRDG